VIVSLKSAFSKYLKAYNLIESCQIEANKFFSDFELEYSLTYCAGDGVMILNCESSLCGTASEGQISRLSKSKNREQALSVLNEINFDR
jgi:hypothetical protein